MSDNAYLIATDHVTILFTETGESHTIYQSQTKSNYEEIVKALGGSHPIDWFEIKKLCDIRAKIGDAIQLTPSITFADGQILYHGKTMHSSLTERMLAMVDDDIDITFLANFLERLLKNPSNRAIHELYPFLEKGELPITEDGHFIAYKRVRNNWKDYHTNTIENKIGDVVEMPRNEVDDEKTNTCSHGLHFCARSYLTHFRNSSENARVLLLKVDPADVVSIPSDHNDAKGRCCRYTVLSEVERDYTLPSHMLADKSIDVWDHRSDDGYTIKRTIVATHENGKVYRYHQLDADHDLVSSISGDLSIPIPYINRVLSGTRKTTDGWNFKYK